jgi:putative endonuclease
MTQYKTTWLSRLRKPKAHNPSLFRHPSEAWAADWLQQQGLILLSHNYQSRFGEIDLIMQEQQIIVFVEVRYRDNGQHGFAAETINQRKQQKLLKTARHYLQHHHKNDVACRIDVLSIDQKADGQPHYAWHRNAFGEN